MADASKLPIVLFVDDEPMVLNAIRRELRKEPWQLEFASSGAEALDILAEVSVDVVVSDMRMPQMNGAEFLKEVRTRFPRILSLLLTGQADLEDTVAAINDGGIFRFLAKPWQAAQLQAALAAALEMVQVRRERDRLLLIMRKQNKMLIDMNQGLNSKLHHSTAELEQIEAMVDASYQEMQNSIQGFVRMFSFVASSRHGMYAGVAERSAELAVCLADLLDCSPQERGAIEQAALLHEIGKIRLPERLLAKEEAGMTKPEREEYKLYPIYGQEMLLTISYLHDGATLVRHHREAWNGLGFPDKLRAESIPLGARILAPCVDYYAMQSGQRMAKELAPEDALDWIVLRSGKDYEPAVIDLFAKAVDLVSAHEKALRRDVIRVDQLVPGDKIVKNLISKSGFLLLSAGLIVNDKVINKLKEIEETHEEQYVLQIDLQVRKAMQEEKDQPPS